MANPQRGEWPLNVGETTYTLHLGTNSLAELEAMAKGRTAEQVILSVQVRRPIADIRLLLWAALRKYHADIAKDGDEGLRAVGDKLDDWSSDDAVVQSLRQLIGINNDPGEQPAEKGKGKARPRKARAGIGERSIESASPSA